MYWEHQNDAGIPLVYEVICKNKFKQMKKYTHHFDNTQLDKSDKYAKVRLLCDITNRSLQQFGFWQLGYSIDEQMIPYFGIHSAKRTVQNKSVHFGYKSFVLASSDCYSYIYTDTICWC